MNPGHRLLILINKLKNIEFAKSKSITFIDLEGYIFQKRNHIENQ